MKKKLLSLLPLFVLMRTAFSMQEQPPFYRDTTLTINTLINTIPLSDVLDTKSAIHKERPCSENGKELAIAQGTSIFVKRGWLKSPKFSTTRSSLRYCDTDAYLDEFNKQKDIQRHIVLGTALLCSNVTLKQTRLHGMQWHHAIILGSNNLADCDKLRAYMEQYEKRSSKLTD